MRIKLSLPTYTKKKWLIIGAIVVVIIALVVSGVCIYHAHHHKPVIKNATSSATANPCSKSTTGNCAPIMEPTGFPSATNTGVPVGTVLTAYSGPLTITAANTIIADKTVDGCLSISAQNVTVMNSSINCDKKNGHGIDVNNQTAGNVLIEDTEVNGDGIADAGVNGSNFTLKQVNIHGSHDGIHEGSNDTVENSYIHDLAKLDGFHSDTVQVVKGNSATDDIFNHDTFDAALPGGVRLNSAFHVGANINHTFIIEDSYLDGGSFTLQFDPSLPANHMIEVINNAFGRDCNDGIFDGGSGVVFTGNYWADNHGVATPANSKQGCTGKTSS